MEDPVVLAVCARRGISNPQGRSNPFARAKDGLLLLTSCLSSLTSYFPPSSHLKDGHTYERKAAEAYLSKFDLSPRTGERLAHKALLPNLMARELCGAARLLEL